MYVRNVRVAAVALASILCAAASLCVDDHGSWSYADADGIDGLVITDIVPTADCGYFMIGYTNRVAFEWYDILAMKLDQFGEVEWAEAIGGPEEEVPLATAAAGDGGYVILATTRTWGPGVPASSRSWMVKLDASGNIERERVYDRGGTFFEIVGPLAENGVLIAGGTNRELWLVELDAAGNEMRQRTIGGTGNEEVHDLVKSADGGFLLLAESNSFSINEEDVWVLKLDGDREIEWERNYGETDSNPLYCRIDSSVDGGYIVAAQDGSDSSSELGKVLLRLSGDGDLLWSKRYDIDRDRSDQLHSIAVMADGGSVLTSKWQPGVIGGDDKVRLWRFDSAGDLLWLQEYGGFLLKEEMFDSIALGDNSVLVAGHRGTQEDLLGKEEVWILRLDGDGLVAGDDCDLMNTAEPTEVPVKIEVTDTQATVTEVQVESWETNATIRDLNVVRQEQCSAPACAPIRCGEVRVSPTEACEGEEVTFTLDHACGEGVLDVGWDLDGDGVVDEQGMRVSTSFGPGEHEVTLIVTDSCALPSPGSCSVRRSVRVISGEPPEEVSGPANIRMRVAPRGERIAIEAPPGVEAYNVYADVLGSWYSPGAPTGSQCHLTGPFLPDGTTELDYSVPAGSWFVVTGSTPCAEGPAGPDSAGAERTLQGTWQRCGPAP